ncbi:MAG: hypothetical protein AAGJ95_09540 [Cyanobacteria bacterium J06554_11]
MKPDQFFQPILAIISHMFPQSEPLNPDEAIQEESARKEVWERWGGGSDLEHWRRELRQPVRRDRPPVVLPARYGQMFAGRRR